MAPVPVSAWLDEPEVKRVEDLPDNPFHGCSLTPEGLRGLLAALDRASAQLSVPSFLRQHPDAPRAA